MNGDVFRPRVQRVFRVFAAVAALTLLTNCNPANFGKDGSTQGPYICGPGGGGGNPRQGVQAELSYFESAFVQSNYGIVQTVLNYFNPPGAQYATRVNGTVFLPHLDFPMRPFNQGFTVPGVGPLKKTNGETLIEWFGLKMKTNLKLAPGDAPGAYQLAVISDDGTIINVVGGGQLINNDGITPTRLKVAQGPINMSAGAELPLEIYWMEGPRFYIAIQLLWRPWNGSAYEPLNGQASEQMYWSANSTPQPAYQQLLSRGWRPLRPENYVLPNGGVNPCQ